MKKGFTLVELLAVIVILAVLALIAVPIVINIINDSKKETSDISIELYGRAVENAKYLYEVNNGVVPVGTFKLSKNGKLISEDGKMTLEVDYDGDIECDTIEIYENGDVYVAGCKVNDEDIEYVYGKTPLYENGEVVYFNVNDGISCTKEEYESSWDETEKDYLNSKTEYNGIKAEGDTTNANSCLKFYAFNDSDKSNKVNLILDHNTTSAVVWSSESASSGPKELLAQLKSDTAKWKGTETPDNYNNSIYTVDYSDSKARLITANEVAQIVGNSTWNETTETTSFYLDSKLETASTTCTLGNISGCQYGWLYDRTSKICKQYGCYNNSNIESTTYTGYWTSSTYPSYAVSAGICRYVSESAELTTTNNPNKLGVRPVIEVLKLKFS